MSEESGFKIERKTGADGTYEQIHETAANVTTYSDTGLDPNTTYFYRVRAFNAAGNSAYSNEASATTETFDPTPCLVTDITDGGGTTFDCYDDGAFNEDLPVGAVGLIAHYVGDSPFFNPSGDDFEDYSDGAYAGGAPGDSVTGFTQIFVGNGP